MNRMIRIIFTGVLAAAMMFQSPLALASSSTKSMQTAKPPEIQPYSMQIRSGESKQTIKTQGFMQDGLLMIPAADLFNHVGFSFKKQNGWQPDYYAKRNSKLTGSIINHLTFTEYSRRFDARIDEGLNGDTSEEMLSLPTYSTPIKGRFYIPLAAMASILNYDVQYNTLNHTITLDYWGNQLEEDTQQIKEFVNHYMTGSVNGYSPDLSLYTAGFLDHDTDMIDGTFSSEYISVPQLVIKDWNIRNLFFTSRNQALVKIPYSAESQVSRTAGGIWLNLLRTDGEWKVDLSTHWSQSFYLNDINERVQNLKHNAPETVTAVKKELYTHLNDANAKKQSLDGEKIDYKTYLKNIEVLYADDHIAYVYARYNWSFKQTEENFDKYSISSDKDFIIMQKKDSGEWVYKERYGSELDIPIMGTAIRGNYLTGYEATFMAFDDYYLDNPKLKSYISFF